jgi:hypothetical protein
MCLYIDKDETKRIRRRFAAAKRNGKNYITCFKELNLYNNKVNSPFYKKVYKPGWNKSNRKNKSLLDIEKEQDYVDKGIHVYSTYKNANAIVFYDLKTYELIKIRCYKKDFISGGGLWGSCLY